MNLRTCTLLAFCLSPCLIAAPAKAQDARYDVGVARVDITPDYPVRLSGFGFRREPSDGVTQRIWAKALAIGSDQQGPAVLITVDNLGIPASMVRDVAKRLERRVPAERLAVTATHTHTAPMLTGVAPTLFGQPIPPEHQRNIDRYTRELTDMLERLALAALADRKPSRLAWGIGAVTFAMNRRTKGGPVDHDLPALVVRGTDGEVRAIYFSYACHCVTLSHNKISGDWAGYAQELIEREHPGAVALVSVGCGADSNPNSGVTGDKVDVAAAQGAEIAAEIKRLLSTNLTPLTGRLSASVTTINLPLDELPTREQWQQLARTDDARGYHAKVNLARLDRGERLKASIDYPIQSWTFGDSLAMVFLPGEVVVDYSLRLKRELDAGRLWINAYSNDAPCYIPSERILREGGYEGGGAMIYYDLPTRLRPGLEERIVGTVRQQLGNHFSAPDRPDGTQGIRPLSPQQSLATIRTRPDLRVELAACEPLVIDPVAIDFGPDGRLWVAEMYDYPSGLAGNFEPGGRVRVLEDRDRDGRFDSSTVFLDNIPFPTGVSVWRQGVLVCAAPDILYAEDTDGDGTADIRKTLFSGFATHNYQARVNSLAYGLDNWVYGACGLFGGEITSFNGQRAALENRDFRLNPDTGEIQPASGRTQQGRVRDDWDNWFGCSNGSVLRHFPLADHYLRRNPYFAPPGAERYVPDYPDSRRVYSISPRLERFNNPQSFNQVTSGCGLGMYRDVLLGEEYAGNTFTCEPVHNLVHRLRLEPRGATFSARRPEGEENVEFLASTDNWFRPVQVRTGPDGALWIVDMYRFVIEHPRWIQPETLATLDVRAGHTRGRIYRVVPAHAAVRPTADLEQLKTEQLVASLDTPNGTLRDLVQQLLVWRRDTSARGGLEKLLRHSPVPAARVSALCTLDGLGAVTPDVLTRSLADPHPGVRRHAVRLAEQQAARSEPLAATLLDMVDAERDPQVQLQLAYSLGAIADSRAGGALARLSLQASDDPYLQAALLSSLNSGNAAAMLEILFDRRRTRQPPVNLMTPLLSTAAALGKKELVPRMVDAVSHERDGHFAAWQFAALASLLESYRGKGLLTEDELWQLQPIVEQARRVATDPKSGEADRLAAIRVVAQLSDVKNDLAVLGQLLDPQNSTQVQLAVVDALGRARETHVPELLIARWDQLTPALRTRVLDALLNRTEGQRALLQAIRQSRVQAAHIDAARRQRLLSTNNEQLLQLAGQLFSAATSDRREVIARYQISASRQGNAENGKEVFALRCANCHRLQNVGHEVGPDLAALSDKSPRALLVAILDPNQAVDDRYLDYAAITSDGRSLSGLLAEETATSLTLLGQEGKRETILRNALDELRCLGKSLMPEGVEKDISVEQMSDLLAYLAGAGATTYKTMPGNQPQVVEPAKDGSLLLAARTAEVYGNEIVFEQPLQNIGMWHGQHDYVAWTANVEHPGSYDVLLRYACDTPSAGNNYVLEGAESTVEGKVASTGGWDQYKEVRIGSVRLEAGRHRLTLRPQGPLIRRALLDLNTIRLVPLDSK